MVILDGAFAGWTRHAVVLVAVLQLISVAPRTARAESDPIAAMVARVSPAVVKIVTVRPAQPDDDKPGVQR